MGPLLLNTIFERYLRLTADGVARSGSGPAVVVWPETAFALPAAQDPVARRYISEAANGNPALIGALRFDRNGRLRNSLFALTDSGTVSGHYDKWHLVPFGEYQPTWFRPDPGGAGWRTFAGPGPGTCTSPACRRSGR